jgi:hypothetical protein
MERINVAASNDHRYDPGEGPRDRSLRVGDKERDTVGEILGQAHVEGRLDADEFQARLDRCMAAKAFAELDKLVADFPRESDEAPRAGRRAYPRPWPLPFPLGPARGDRRHRYRRRPFRMARHSVLLLRRAVRLATLGGSPSTRRMGLRPAAHACLDNQAGLIARNTGDSGANPRRRSARYLGRWRG